MSKVGVEIGLREITRKRGTNLAGSSVEAWELNWHRILYAIEIGSGPNRFRNAHHGPLLGRKSEKREKKEKVDEIEK